MSVSQTSTFVATISASEQAFCRGSKFHGPRTMADNDARPDLGRALGGAEVT